MSLVTRTYYPKTGLNALTETSNASKKFKDGKYEDKILLDLIYLIQSSKAIQEINKQQPSKNSIGFLSTTYISRWDLCFLEVEGMHSRNTPRH